METFFWTTPERANGIDKTVSIDVLGFFTMKFKDGAIMFQIEPKINRFSFLEVSQVSYPLRRVLLNATDSSKLHYRLVFKCIEYHSQSYLPKKM